MSFFEKSEADLKELLLEWLIKWGCDWVDYKLVAPDEMRFEIGRLERNGLLDYNYRLSRDTSQPIMYRISEKGMLLLEKDIT